MRLLLVLALAGGLAEAAVRSPAGRDALGDVRARQQQAIDRLVCEGWARAALESADAIALAAAREACARAWAPSPRPAGG